MRLAHPLILCLLLGLGIPASANQAPVAVDDSYSVLHDQTLSVSPAGVLANDTDPDGNTLYVTAVAANPQHGTLTWQRTGDFTYTPAYGYVGMDSFTYIASDGITESNPASVTIAVASLPPIAVLDTFRVPFPTGEPLNVLANDSDPDSGFRLWVANYSLPQHGTLVWDDIDLRFYYTPAFGYKGQDSFTYEITDGWSNSAPAMVILTVGNDPPIANAGPDQTVTASGATASVTLDGSSSADPDGDPIYWVQWTEGGQFLANDLNPTISLSPGTHTIKLAVEDPYLADGTDTVTITVLPSNRAPVANPDSFTVLHDHLLVKSMADLLANDSDPDGDPLDARFLSQAQHGTVELRVQGTFSYTPDAGFVGQDSVTYEATDIHGASSGPQTVTFTVTNTAPSANAGPDQTVVTTDPTAPVTLDGSGSFDRDGDPLTYSWSEGGATLATGANPTVSLAPGTHTLTLTVSDNAGATATDTVTILVVEATNPPPVPPANHPPVAQGFSVVLNEDTATAIPLQASDADGDPLTYTIVAPPQHGSLSGTPPQVTYQPQPNYTGTDSFAFKVNDGKADSNTAVVSLTIRPVNDPPVAVSDTTTATAGSAVTVAAPGVLGNDSDVDGDSLSAVLVGPPSHGFLTLKADGSFTYTPRSGFVGKDRFTYKASDGQAFSNEATVTVNVVIPAQVVQQFIQAAIAQVNTLVSTGALPATVGDSIINTLNAAQQYLAQSGVQLTSTQLATVRQSVQGAITQVNSLVSSGRLTPTQGQAVTSILQALLSQLGG